MELLAKRFYRPVPDPMQMPGALIELEDELIKAGYTVKPRSGPVVVILLENGEVHFVPDKGGIWEYLFLGKGEPTNHETTGL